MKEITYNKLVRDRIPEIIETSGKQCVTETLSEEAYLQMLDTKLQEELTEYFESHSIEELADFLELIYASAKARGSTPEQLEQKRSEKAKSNGAFDQKILLKMVKESCQEIK